MPKPPFRVIYVHRGKTASNVFWDLSDAILDYQLKLALDREQVFDDRFVLGIEDDDGVRVVVEDS
jgi:hypothetical protein